MNALQKNNFAAGSFVQAKHNAACNSITLHVLEVPSITSANPQADAVGPAAAGNNSFPDMQNKANAIGAAAAGKNSFPDMQDEPLATAAAASKNTTLAKPGKPLAVAPAAAAAAVKNSSSSSKASPGAAAAGKNSSTSSKASPGAAAAGSNSSSITRAPPASHSKPAKQKDTPKDGDAVPANRPAKADLLERLQDKELAKQAKANPSSPAAEGPGRSGSAREMAAAWTLPTSSSHSSKHHAVHHDAVGAAAGPSLAADSHPGSAATSSTAPAAARSANATAAAGRGRDDTPVSKSLSASVLSMFTRSAGRRQSKSSALGEHSKVHGAPGSHNASAATGRHHDVPKGSTRNSNSATGTHLHPVASNSTRLSPQSNATAVSTSEAAGRHGNSTAAGETAAAARHSNATAASSSATAGKHSSTTAGRHNSTLGVAGAGGHQIGSNATTASDKPAAPGGRHTSTLGVAGTGGHQSGSNAMAASDKPATPGGRHNSTLAAARVGGRHASSLAAHDTPGLHAPADEAVSAGHLSHEQAVNTTAAAVRDLPGADTAEHRDAVQRHNTTTTEHGENCCVSPGVHCTPSDVLAGTVRAAGSLLSFALHLLHTLQRGCPAQMPVMGIGLLPLPCCALHGSQSSL